MGALRERFIQDLKLSGRSERTIECYVRHIKKLAYFYHISPDLINEEELPFFQPRDAAAFIALIMINLCLLILFKWS